MGPQKFLGSYTGKMAIYIKGMMGLCNGFFAYIKRREKLRVNISSTTQQKDLSV